MKKWMLGAGALLVSLGLLTACGSESTNNVENGGDQTGLNIGETAYVDSIIDHYEITLNSVEFISEFEGEEPELNDDFLVAEFTVKNLNDDPIDAHEAVNKFELESLSDISRHIEGFESISGELQTGEETTGLVIYETREADEQNLSISPGLASVGGIDDIYWTFYRSEVE